MATRQITIKYDELQVLLLANLNMAIGRLSSWDLDGAEDALKRAGELHLALKEAVAALPKPANSAAEGKRA